MPVYIANNTIKAFEDFVKVDQGNAYRSWLGKVIPHLDDAYRQNEDAFRSHLGASLLGDECGRAVWYGFRWTTRNLFEGRILRLFNRGHLEEARFIALLLTIGVQVFQQDEKGNQYRISWAEGHAGGSGDSVVRNCPDVPPGTAVNAEFKTHNEKSFRDLAGKNWKEYVTWLVKPRDENGKPFPVVRFEGKGVRESKFEHFVQVQIYMYKMGLPACLYLAVNKDTDEIYAELIMLDKELAEKFIDRGEKIVWMKTPPQKINQSAGWFGCRFCDHRPVCHLGASPDKNCRTCAYSEPVKDAKWVCTHPEHNKELSKQDQLAGCGDYQRHKSI